METTIEEHADNLLNKYLEIGKKYIRNGNEHGAMFIFIPEEENEERFLVAFVYKDNEEKHKMLTELKTRLNSEQGKSRIKEYIFLSEGWGVKVKNKEDIPSLIGKIAKQPDRMEYLVLLYAHKNGYTKSKGVQIFREGDKVVFVEMINSDQSESIFFLYD